MEEITGFLYGINLKIMDNEVIIFLLVLIVLGIFVIRFIARVFLKVILMLILVALAVYLFFQNGGMG
jgi:hypothetical protein